MTNTFPPMRLVALPPGWLRGVNGDCVVYRPLEQFTYAEVRYEPSDTTYDYALYHVNVEGPGPYVQDKRGTYPDLGKAIRAGDRL